jgi:hypothetical protein
MAPILGGSRTAPETLKAQNMAPARAAAYLGGTLLLVAWLASAAGVSRRQPGIQIARPQAEALQLDALAVDVQSQAVRLRTRLAAAPAPQMPLRNPFMFAATAAPVHRMAAPVEPLKPPVPEAPDLVLELAGVAEQNTASGVKRTAMVAAPGDQLYMVTEGQELAGRYRVSAVGADAVELKDLVTGATRRLALR